MMRKSEKQKRDRNARRGSTLIESTLALWTFAILIAGILELGFAGMVANTMEFAVERAARYASVRGSSSGHPAQQADIQSIAQQYATPLIAPNLPVTVNWLPNNNPGNTVEVQATYSIVPSILPITSGKMTFQATAKAIILQ